MCEVRINRLPAPTWRWLKVNDANVKLPGEWVPAEVEEELAGAVTGGEGLSLASGLGQEFGETIEKAELSAGRYSSAGKEGKLYIRNHFTRDIALAREEIRVKEGESLFAVIEADGAGKTAAHDVRIRLEKEADLTLVEILRPSDDAVYLDGVYAEAEEKASFRLIQLVLGGGQVYLGQQAELLGEESRAEMDMGYLLAGDKTLDINAVARHRGRNTESRIGISGVLEDRAKKNFRGTLDFIRGASGAKGQERENVLLMSDEVSNITVPLILCGEEDVEGEHGATIGRISDETLFYFQSRGIPEEMVGEMMARSMVDQVISRIPEEGLRRKLLGEEE